MIHIAPPLDSDSLAKVRADELMISKEYAMQLAKQLVEIVERGFYELETGERILIDRAMIKACLEKQSIPPWLELKIKSLNRFANTTVHVTNETTLGATRRLCDSGHRPLVLNFANGVEPGGRFLLGARVQEESICRLSLLYWTLIGDPMYLYNRYCQKEASSAWAILSPNVPIIKTDSQQFLREPQFADFLTCAAPYAPVVGQPTSANLLKERINRVLEIAGSWSYTSLVLGAWGCGAFSNDILQTAKDFREAIEINFENQFDHIVFAIADWSPERRLLKPFISVFS